MQKKDILEIKKRYKKDQATFSKMCGCYVNGEKNIVTKFRETFLNLEEAEYHKYLEIAKKVLSGTVGNNILELNFHQEDEASIEKRDALMQLKRSRLLRDDLLDEFYQRIIDEYHYVGNFIILLYHDAYDVITKTEDNIKIDESEEVYEYVLCAICPVSLTDPGLSYVENENRIKARQRDWVVEAPASGFVYPAFIDRSQDIDALLYYTKNAKDPHPELMEDVLGCYAKETSAIQKESFQAMVKGTLDANQKESDLIFMEVQDQLQAMVEEHKSLYADMETEPIVMDQHQIREILKDSGVPEEITKEITESYDAYFGENLPLVESLIDQKVLKEKDLRRNEVRLKKEVKELQGELEKARHDEDTETFDVILKVKEEKVSKIRTEIIEGKKFILIPMEEDEQALVNGQEDLI
jgi:hypothetical protein